LEGWVFGPRQLSDLPQRPFGKSVQLGRLSKKQNSGFDLPPIVITKNNFKKTQA